MTGEHVLPQVRAHVDAVVRVSDDAIAAALAILLERTKLLVEPAGAAGYAALLAGALDLPADARVVVVASGGNVDLATLSTLLQRAAAGGGDVAYGERR
jgi:threonine dehydratase